MADRHNVLAARGLLNARGFAREFSHPWIGSEHLLLGILGLEGSAAQALLRARGVDGEALRREVERMLPADVKPERARLPLADSLRRVIDAARELTGSGVLEEVRLEHLLLAMLRERAGMGYALLLKQDVDVLDLERDLVALLEGEGTGQGSVQLGA
ncbi:MAG: hypothetical protein HY812_19440 [Planctomycetes bacterium]|nr:hypothetical protein [Planctomycetota bacterium]